MKYLLILLITSLLIIACGEQEVKRPDIKPPVAEKIPKELTIHADTRIDNYYWLNERDNPKVKEYLEAENEYTAAMMKHTEEFQEVLYEEIVGRIKQDDESVPYKDNGYYYYYKYEEGKEYPIYCRKKGSLEADEEILLNVNEMAEGYSFYSVVGLRVSPDNKLLSFGVDTLSRRKYDLHFKNLETGEILDDVITLTTGSSVWANDNKTIFYTRKDPETLRSFKIFRHKLSEDETSDATVFEEKDTEFSCYVYKTKSKKYIIVGSYQTLSQEYRFLDADNPTGKFKVFQPREMNLEHSIAHYGDHFYIVTNWDARNFRLMKTPVNKTEKSNWEEVIAHRDDVLLERIEIFDKYLVVDEREKGLEQMRIIRWDDNSEHYIEFPEAAYSAGISTNKDFDTDLLRIRYSSLTTPTCIYDYNMSTREKTLLKQDEVLGDFNQDDYYAERLMAPARDGQMVPISLVYKKGLEKNGDNPLLLYGYGSYGASMSASFRSDRLSLLDRGFVYAIAHVRGGEEMGRWWYDDGKLLNKKNTFYDFIDCAKYLIDQKFTNPDKMFCQGGSAGGLLIGAVINMAPELFKGAVAGVPFVDVVTTMLDESIPLTTFEFDEWGDPKEKVYYDYMLSYSPYDNVERKDYPALLITTGFHDSQVQYFEPAKWIAKLRTMKTDNNLLIMDCNMDVGHGGASGRFKRWKRRALEFAFMFDQLGIYE
jgi:oligopeptidase B